MNYRKFKFIIKNLLQFGPSFARYYLRCHGSAIRAWRNPFSNLVPEPASVHILAGSDQFAMALWMMVSWFEATRKNWDLVLHSDGSLTEKHIVQLTEMGVRFRAISFDYSNEMASKVLSSYPHCLSHRTRSVLAKKIYDTRIHTNTEKYFVFDTDLLFYDVPERLIGWSASASNEFWFNRDVEEAALLSKEEVETLFGFSLWSKVNSGLVCAFRQGIEFEDTEEFLAKSRLRTPINDWMLEQTLFALHASKWAIGGVLPEHYEVTLCADRSRDCICRHYVGTVRQYYYLEGIKDLKLI